jgi:GT2 family glycosyltransferase
MAVTGLVAPYELETRAQILFERYGGFGCGFKRKWYQVDGEHHQGRPFHLWAGHFGTGANMAFRCRVFEQIGSFDPALDVGTVTNGGGDLEMFFRVLEEGYTLVYDPAALVWHRHRKNFDELRVQLTNHGIGLYSFFVRSALVYPHRRWSIFKFGLWFFWYWDVRRLVKSFIATPHVPRKLILAELRGALIGLSRYPKARRRAREIEVDYANGQDSRSNSKLQSERSG